VVNDSGVYLPVGCTHPSIWALYEAEPTFAFPAVTAGKEKLLEAREFISISKEQARYSATR
jgi:hypothetical protein